MLAGNEVSLISFTIFIISSKLYFIKGPWYPGVGIGPSSPTELEFCKGGKLAELISMVARCVVALAVVPAFGPPFTVLLVESFPALPLCREPDAVPFYGIQGRIQCTKMNCRNKGREINELEQTNIIEHGNV